MQRAALIGLGLLAGACSDPPAPFQIAQVALPDGKQSLAVLNTQNGLLWVMTCSATCVANDHVGQDMRRKMILGEGTPFMEPIRYRYADGAQGRIPPKSGE